jgi:hypothetical protein
MLSVPRPFPGGIYHDPLYPTINVEVPYDIPDDMTAEPQPLMSSSETSNFWPDAAGNPRPLPKPYPGFWMFSRAGGTTRVPDIVITKDPTQPPQKPNIARVVEIKFPPDQWREGQFEAYSRIDPTGEPLQLSPEACLCQAPEPEPALQSAPDWKRTAEITTLVAAAVVLSIIPGAEEGDIPILARLAQLGVKFGQ